MFKLNRGIRVGLAGIVTVLLAAGAGLFFMVSAGNSAPLLSLDGVDFAGLEQQGITLKAPADGAEARVKIQAQEAPARAGAPLPVKEVVLGQLVTSNVPRYDRLVWIVSYSHGLPISGVPAAIDEATVPEIEPASYRLAFIDAETGEFLFSIQANRLRQ